MLPFIPTASRSHLSVPNTTDTPPLGAYIQSLWVPFDVWPRIAAHLSCTADQISFYSVCRSARAAVLTMHARRLAAVRRTFHCTPLSVPSDIARGVIAVHPLPTSSASCAAVVLARGANGGVELVWLKSGTLRRVALGLDTVPASAASHLCLSPDGSRVACLVTLAHPAPPHDAHDPLHRLRGWERVSRAHGHVVDIAYHPCHDCTVQVVDLIPTQGGRPHALQVTTFSHVFVPEYGFDMVWRQDDNNCLELSFAAMLHSAAGAATYLVRWRGFKPIEPYGTSTSQTESVPTPSHPVEPQQLAVARHAEQTERPNFVFMACIDGASTELLEDKRHAMMTKELTSCTSRINLSNDGRSIFFDTVTKFGILRFDQIEDAMTTRVTRADLSNAPRFPHSPPRRARRCHLSNRDRILPTISSEPSARSSARSSRARRSQRSEEGEDEDIDTTATNSNQTATRISLMSPDGSLLCSLVCTGKVNVGNECLGRYLSKTSTGRGSGSRHIEMRSSTTGRLIYRRLVHWPRQLSASHSNGDAVQVFSVEFDKSASVARHAINFSEDSNMVVLWDAHVHRGYMHFTTGLPIIFDARTGRTVQDFGGNIRIMPTSPCVDRTYSSFTLSSHASASSSARPSASSSAGPSRLSVTEADQRHYMRRMRKLRGSVPGLGKREQRAESTAFCRSVNRGQYDDAQISPDALTVYATRVSDTKMVMDAIDTVSGQVIKSVTTKEMVLLRSRPLSNSNYVVQGNVLHVVSRGWVRTPSQTSKCHMGCAWSGRRRLDEHEEYGEEEEDDESIDGHYEIGHHDVSLDTRLGRQWSSFESSL